MPIHVRPIRPGSYLLRLYQDHDGYESKEDYTASCVLSLDRTIARIEGLTSKRAILRRDIVDAMRISKTMGAVQLRIERAPGHVMPFAAFDGQEWIINLENI